MKLYAHNSGKISDFYYRALNPSSNCSCRGALEHEAREAAFFQSMTQ